MSVYRVESGGRAPAGLSAGDEVVTGGGTYRITGVNADGSYQSQLVNKNQTTRNYGGSYQTRNSPYTMSGVSDYTRSKLNGLEGGYMPSGSVQAALAYLEQVKASKPDAYQSRWDDELTSLYDQIRNRKKFSYDMGTDPLYLQYREQYQRLGRLAMQDTMGQAAALTGGYGSTYGEQVGQQAYNAYLQNLNDIVPQLQQQAYQRYQDEGTDLYSQYSLVKGREDTDYGRYPGYGQRLLFGSFGCAERVQLGAVAGPEPVGGDAELLGAEGQQRKRCLPAGAGGGAGGSEEIRRRRRRKQLRGAEPH